MGKTWRVCEPQTFEVQELLQALASLTIGLFWTKSTTFKSTGKSTPETTTI